MTAVATDIESTFVTEVPEAFIAEYLDGIPMYYKGYRSIINNPSQIDTIMGAGGIHALFTIHFALLLSQILNKDEYCITGGEAGYRPEKNNLFSLDLAVYKRETLAVEPLEYEFSKEPPVIVVEIDTSVENDTLSEYEYILSKTQRLLDFGTERVVWFFTKTKKIMIAQPDDAWKTYNWNEEAKLMDQVSFNLYQYCVDNRLLNLINLSI